MNAIYKVVLLYVLLLVIAIPSHLFGQHNDSLKEFADKLIIQRIGQANYDRWITFSKTRELKDKSVQVWYSISIPQVMENQVFFLLVDQSVTKLIEFKDFPIANAYIPNCNESPRFCKLLKSSEILRIAKKKMKNDKPSNYSISWKRDYSNDKSNRENKHYLDGYFIWSVEFPISGKENWFKVIDIHGSTGKVISKYEIEVVEEEIEEF